MRRFLIVLIGLTMLIAAVLVLWAAHGPQATEARTTGGVLYTQQQLALEVQTSGPGATDLGTVVDVDIGGAPATMELQPQIAAGALTDLSTADSFEIAAAPATTDQVTVPAGGAMLTNDVVLDEATGVEIAPLSAQAGVDVSGQGGFSQQTMGYEQRVVELEWPANFRVGRAGSVRVKLKVLADGSLQPVAEIADNEVLATPILITDRYDTHFATVTATLSAPDFDVDSVTSLTQPMTRGSEPEWRWTLTASSAQTSIISLGLRLSWQPKTTGAPPAPTDVPIWGQTLQVESSHVFGFITVPQASVAGTVLAVLGGVAQFPLLEKFLELLWNIVFGRRRRRQRSSRQTRNRRNRDTRGTRR